jgi:hypothetical protein
METVVKRVYESFIMEMDAIDNGVEVCDGPQRYRCVPFAMRSACAAPLSSLAVVSLTPLSLPEWIPCYCTAMTALLQRDDYTLAVR